MDTQMHIAAVQNNNVVEALTVGQLLTEVGKLKVRLAKAEKPAAKK